MKQVTLNTGKKQNNTQNTDEAQNNVRKKTQKMPFVVNNSRKKVLSYEGEILRNPFRQAFGMMFHRKPTCYVFAMPWSTEVAITNLFVFHPLDLLWLDEQQVVVDLRKDFPPWALHAGPLRKAKYVVELPAGAIALSGTKIGDRMAIRGL